MKKKIYKFVSVAVIAVAMAVSVQMSKANSATTLTMENVEALAMAGGEGFAGHLCAFVTMGTCVYDDGYVAPGKWQY